MVNIYFADPCTHFSILRPWSRYHNRGSRQSEGVWIPRDLPCRTPESIRTL